MANFELSVPLPDRLVIEDATDQGARLTAYIDPTTGANGTSSSYCVEYETDAASYEVSTICHDLFDFRITQDLSPYEGISFYVKADPPLLKPQGNLRFELHQNGPGRGPTGEAPEIFRVESEGAAKWSRFALPFTSFAVVTGTKALNGVLDLNEVDSFHSAFCLRALQGGETGRVWIDEVVLYTADVTPMPPLTATPSPEALPKVSAEEVWHKIKSSDSFVLVDVRAKVAFDQGHIHGAVSMPLQELPQRSTEIDRQSEVIVYAACT